MPKRGASPIVVGGLGNATMRYELAQVADSTEASATNANKRAQISVHETTPWSKGLGSHDSLSFSAEFDDLSGGLSRPERERRLGEVRGRG